jgi:hypothetical protein
LAHSRPEKVCPRPSSSCRTVFEPEDLFREITDAGFETRVPTHEKFQSSDSVFKFERGGEESLLWAPRNKGDQKMEGSSFLIVQACEHQSGGFDSKKISWIKVR